MNGLAGRDLAGFAGVALLATLLTGFAVDAKPSSGVSDVDARARTAKAEIRVLFDDIGIRAPGGHLDVRDISVGERRKSWRRNKDQKA